MSTKIKCATYRDGDPLPRYAQVKRDGIFLRVTGDGCFTSHPSDVTEQVDVCCPNLLLAAHTAMLSHESNILGELYSPSRPASDVKSALAKGRPLLFDAFALESMIADASMQTVADWCGDLSFAPWTYVASVIDGPWDLETCWEWAQRYDDCEGLIFKDGNLPTANHPWVKWKPVKTIDLVCTGFTEGEGKYLGAIGSLLGSIATGQEVASVSGMTDLERWTITANEEQYLGRVFECEYQYVGAKGRLRHPRFKQWRDDKQAQECGLDQDPQLQAYYEQ